MPCHSYVTYRIFFPKQPRDPYIVSADSIQSKKEQIMNDFPVDTLAALPLASTGASVLHLVIGAAILVVCAVVADVVARRVLLVAVGRWSARSKTDLDDILVEHQVFKRLAHLAPAVVVHLGAPFLLPLNTALVVHLQLATRLYILIVAALVISAFLSAVATIWQRRDGYKHVPIRGFMQVVQILVFLAAAITALSMLLHRSPAFLLSGLGALTAVLMLVFKDAILGLVAGIQLSANDMLRIGDWLEMPKYGADGDVMDISLTTVKVQNWDKTISTIPAYALISDSFKNWRGMSQSDGRRIKRSIHIDMTSIRFCTPEMIERFRKMQVLQPYIDERVGEVDAFNREQGIDDSTPVNGRRLTNVGTFRAYIVSYLRNHPQINQDMTFLIRQLEPTDHGLPMQVYVFSADKVWANYEAIQSDIFDHLLAIIPEFGLRVFQHPTGADLQSFTSR